MITDDMKRGELRAPRLRDARRQPREQLGDDRGFAAEQRVVVGRIAEDGLDDRRAAIGGVVRRRLRLRL